MIFRLFTTALLASLILTAFPHAVHARSYIAYISDSTSSSVIYWLAKEVGIFKKHGLDLDTIFINGSVRGIQSLIAGDLCYSGAVGTAVINSQPLRRRYRHYSEPDEHPALLHHRQCQHQVCRRFEGSGGGRTYPRNVG